MSSISTTDKGTAFENTIYDYFDDCISSGGMPFKKECCTLIKKPKYYSKDRESDIIFDLSVEVRLPGFSEVFLVIIIECKNYNHPVPVDDVEEFFAKVQQVQPAKVKPIIATSNSFQRGSLNFAKNKGIGLFRYLGKSTSKWELHRGYQYTQRIRVNNDSINEKLTEEAFETHESDVYGQYCDTLIATPYDFFYAIVKEYLSEIPKKFLISRRKNKNPIPFLSEDYITKKALSLLKDINYETGSVSLEKITSLETLKTGLVFQKSETSDLSILGKITFEPPRIEVFKNDLDSSDEQFRFTVAHELGHYFLNHGVFIKQEIFSETDLMIYENNQHTSARARLEYQANRFASSLLLPLEPLMEELALCVNAFDIRLASKRFLLYIDDQRCNINTMHLVLGRMSRYFKVSKQVVYFRLKEMGLLVDTRKTSC